MQKLLWYSIQQLTYAQETPLLRCIGRVASIDSKPSYYSFVLSDDVSQMEATVYEEQQDYRELDMPQVGDSVVVVGSLVHKEAGKMVMSKIKVQQFKVVRDNEQKMYYARIKKYQQQKASLSTLTVANTTKRSLTRQLRNSITPLEMRSLILECVYITMDSNPDLGSYIFSLYTIQKHRQTRALLELKKIKDDAIEYLSEFIDAEMRYLVELRVVEEKDVVDGQRRYVAYRNIFNNLEMRIMGFINERQKAGGTLLADLVAAMNREHNLMDEKNYIFNDSFMAKVLRKLIGESRIYKTSDKVMYVNG